MKKVLLVTFLISAIFLLNACQTSELDIVPNPQAKTPVRAIPMDVMTAYIAPQALVPQAVNVNQGNLFDNGGFESGLTGWTGCDAGAIAESNDAYEGNKALKVNAGNCFYRSVETSPGDDLILSCYARLQSGSAWTGMGLGFADANWTTIPGGPSTIITGNNYQRYDVEATAPAGSKYVSMWMYSDNPAVVDSCSLMLEQEPPPPPPPPSGGNLLENPTFNGLDNWSVGCGNSVITPPAGAVLQGGPCLDQSLSASDIDALRGNDYTYSCVVKNTSDYASMSIFLNGVPSSKVIPLLSSFTTVKLKGTAANNIDSGFVSLYADGSALVVQSCSLTVDGAEPPPPSGDNLLDNGGFENLDANNKPNNWTKGCGGTWSSVVGRSGKGLQLQGGVCIDQTLSSSDLSALSGNEYTYSCYAKNTGGYASITLFQNGQPKSVVIPASNTYQLVEVTGTAGQVSSGFVSIYSEAGLTVDDCSLVVEGGSQPTGTPSIDVRNNVEGEDYFATKLPFTFDIAVRNNGDVPLTNVKLESAELDCGANFPSLAVGETKNLVCISNVVPESTFPGVGSFFDTITATGTTADGRVVTDSDSSGYRNTPRATGRLVASIVPDKSVISAGDDVTFYVVLGHGGNVGSVSEIQSNVPDCARQLSPNLGLGELISYECVATNVQEGFVATIGATTNGPYGGSGGASTEITVQ